MARTQQEGSSAPAPGEDATGPSLFLKGGFLLRRLQKSQDVYLHLLAVVVGLIMGGVCAVFRLLINVSHELFVAGGGHGEGQGATFVDLAFRASLPALGGLLVGLVVYRVLKLSGGHGVPSVMKAIATGNMRLSPMMAVKSSSSIVTITSGGSCGPEGPIIEIGSVVGSWVGQWAAVTKERVGTLIGCGAASGIAGVFNAPIGGVFLALELLMRDFAGRTFAPVVVAAVVAAVTNEALLPNSPVFPKLSDPVLQTIAPNYLQMGMFAGLGLLCGLIGALLVYTLYRLHDLFQGIRVPLWLKPALGGLGVGLVGLAYPNVIGEGYEFVSQGILEEYTGNGTLAFSAAALFLFVALVKILVTGLTLGSGGTGGSFAPAMVTGAMTGAGFGVLCNILFPGAAPSVAVFSLVGMAGVVCSSLQIPIAGILIVYEVSGASYRLVLPLMITVAISAVLSSALRQGSVYTLTLLRDGFDVDEAIRKVRDPLSRVPLEKIMNRKFIRLSPNDNLDQVIDAFSASEDDAFAVIDGDDTLLGMVSTRDIRGVLNLAGIGEAIIAADAADMNPPMLYPQSPASEALAVFSSTDATAIPVVEKPGSRRIVGLVNRVDILSAYRGAAAQDAG